MQSINEVTKVTIIGPCRAGKSTIFQNIRSKDPYYEYVPTIGANFGVEMRGKNHKITFWDTSGNQKYSNLLTMCLKKAHYILVIFSKYDREEFQNVTRYLQLAKQHAPESKVLLIANSGLRCDQSEDNAITDEEILTLRMENDIEDNRYREISAKSKEDVETICTLIHNETKRPFAYENTTLVALNKLKSYAFQDAQDLYNHISNYYTNDEYRNSLRDSQSSLRNNSQTKKHIQNLQLQSILVSILNFITALVLHTVFLPISFAYCKMNEEDNLSKRNRENKGSACMFFDFAPKQKAQIAVHLAEKDYMSFNQ